MILAGNNEEPMNVRGPFNSSLNIQEWDNERLAHNIYGSRSRTRNSVGRFMFLVGTAEGDEGIKP